jgi:hypothetical protein
MPGLVLGEARFAEFRFEPHYHLDYHIGVIPHGAQRQCFNGGSEILAPGRISVMPPGQIHDGSGVDGQGYTLKTFRLSAALVDRFSEEVSGKCGDAEWVGTLIENPRLASHLPSGDGRWLLRPEPLQPRIPQRLWRSAFGVLRRLMQQRACRANYISAVSRR